MSPSREAIARALSQVSVPGGTESVTEAGRLAALHVTEDGAVRVGLRPEGLSNEVRRDLAMAVGTALRAVAGVASVELEWSSPPPERAASSDDPVPGVRHIVLVMSGKGGVGKSTVCSNLAVALARSGARVGLLDADMYGPSIPTMFGVNARPVSTGTQIRPLERFSVKLMSIGFLLDDDKSAVVWRGPMLHGALVQFLRDVEWGQLDYLLLDLPPGTGDIALTLAQQVRSSGAVIVTTPQEVALQDVYKSVSMARKVGIEILGVVENESYFLCDGCNKRHELFGSGGGQKIADFAAAPLLGQVPVDVAIRQWGDAGTPVVQASPGSASAQELTRIAARLVERIGEVAEAHAPLTIDRSGGQQRHLPISR